MYLIARFIKSMGIKMVLTGEGADEIFGGYLYFHKAPNPEEFHKESLRKVSKLNLYDCLRANKSLAAWGVEGRVPFLDKEFMDVAMRINPKDKMAGSNGKMEKWVLRKAFEDILPESVAWRQKEQFSDGVGYGWIDTLKQVASEKVTDEMMDNAKYRFPINTPMSKEEYHYRYHFRRAFPERRGSSLCALGKVDRMQYCRSIGMGCIVPEQCRPIGTCRYNGTRTRNYFQEIKNAGLWPAGGYV
jgi:asparagine synthase (glutamine-hydrolysing)